MKTMTQAKQEKRDEDKECVLDSFSYDTAYMFGKALIKNLGFDTLNDAYQRVYPHKGISAHGPGWYPKNALRTIVSGLLGR